MRALVVGGTSGVGAATATALRDVCWGVLATGSERDATEPETVRALLDEADPDLVVVAAGARPHMAPLAAQSWATFSAAWEVDVRIAFEVGQTVLARPLRPGATVVVVSSGAALEGSPLSGGYAGAKRMQMLLVGYLQQAATASGSDTRFLAVVPQQLLTGSVTGNAAAAAYGAAAGLDAAQFLARRFPVALDAAGVAAAIVAVALDGAPERALALGVHGDGVAVLA